MKAWTLGSRGQAVVGAILIIALAGATWETLAIAWLTGENRLVLQDSLDGGASTGAAILADGLNVLATTNVALLALGITAVLGFGEGAYWAARLQRAQDELIRRLPGLAKQVAWGTAITLGAHWTQPATVGAGRWPSLMVRRVYLLPQLFGSRFPLWIADDLRPVENRRWGDRVIYLEGGRLVRQGVLNLPLRARSGAAAAKPGGGASSLPLLTPSYDSRLIPFAEE